MSKTSFADNLGATLKGCIKILAQSRSTSIKRQAKKLKTADRSLIIMGNGPSLRQTIDNHSKCLAEHDLLAVNFAANAPEFKTLKPEIYVLADPFFFGDTAGHDNLKALHDNLAGVDWPMLLVVPAKYRKRLPDAIANNENITVATINAVGVEGFTWFQNAAYGRAWAMPRPRNVLITAIMAGIWLGYKKITIVGADHSWMQSIWVDDDNRVVSVQPHFYKDSAKEQKRVDNTYAGYHLHDIVYSFYVAFSSYHRIAAFAHSCNV